MVPNTRATEDCNEINNVNKKPKLDSQRHSRRRQLVDSASKVELESKAEKQASMADQESKNPDDSGGFDVQKEKEIQETNSCQYCTIEASVVTGFEECARGEAKEKFDTDDVKAVRGKITWKVPVDRVTDVVKMGSIDNARVVVHSVPHFKFTDQYDSLARLQQMVPSVDWESGLNVWGKFNDFPYPIASKPDVIPSLDDLIDICIAKQPPPVEKGEKKGKKGVRGKKKEKRKEKKQAGSGDAPSGTSDGSNVDEAKAATKELKPTEELYDKVEQTALVDESTTKKDNVVSELVKFESLSHKTTEKNSTDSNAQSPYIKSPTTVIIKKADRSQPEPEVEIKVLIPGPNENMFPSQVDEGDARELEPMEVDQSLNQSRLEATMSSPKDSSKQTNKTVEFKGTGDAGLIDNKNVKTEKQTSGEEGANDVSGEKSAMLEAAHFASEIIHKLTTPPQSPEKLPTGECTPSETTKCVTPPPTPVRSSDTIDMSSVFSQLRVSGSSVDPPLFATEQTTVKEPSEPALSGECNSNATIEEETQTKIAFPEVTALSSELQDGKEKTFSQALLTGLKESELPSSIQSVVNEIQEKTEEPKEVKKERDPTKPTFRVTCNRVGEGHPFDSASAAASFGSAIITYFDWGVNLKNFDIEVLLNIDNEEVTVSLALTKTSLHNRNIVAFGPTTLRATICYNMLRLCRIRNGDFVCDPMCGSSAIPIEGAINWTNCFHFGGDFHPMAMDRTAKNIAAVEEKNIAEKKSALKIDAVRWNIESFPLRDKCVDVFISDLPFGHRMGSRATNRVLYPCLLTQMARTARTGARACLLTEDKTSLIKGIQSYSKYWQRRLILSVNIGGLSGFVFLLTRTTAAFAPSVGSWKDGKTEKEQPGSASSSPSKSAPESTPAEGSTNGSESVNKEGSGLSEVTVLETGALNETSAVLSASPHESQNLSFGGQSIENVSQNDTTDSSANLKQAEENQ